MIDLTELKPRLDDQLDGLPATPVEHYLSAGRAARGRRRRHRALGAVGAFGLAVASVLVATQVLPLGPSDSGLAREHRPSVTAADGPVAPSSLSSLQVQAGVGDIDSYSTDEVPAWATEYGNHGPAAIAPDGRLWVAPESSVVRSIDDPLGAAPGVAQSYALEVEWRGDLWWWWSYQQVGDPDSTGTMDDADRWTTDFALWAENESGAVALDRSSFANRLVRFADSSSKLLVAQPGVTILDQVTDVDTGDMQHYARRSAAEVELDEHVYFVLANGRAVGHDFYEPYEAVLVGSDLQSFLAFVAGGFESQGTAP